MVSTLFILPGVYFQCRTNIRNRNEIRFIDRKHIIFPNWIDLLKHAYWNNPRYFCQVFVYQMFKKRYEKEQFPFFKIFLHRCLNWMTGFPSFAINMAYYFSITCVAAIRKDEPNFWTETLLFDLYSFATIYMSTNRQTCSLLRIYFNDNKVIFNPPKASNSLYYYRRNTSYGYSSHIAKNTHHVYIGDKDNQLGFTACSHPPKYSKWIPTKGKQGSCIIINQIVDSSVKSDDITRVAPIIDAIGLNNFRYLSNLMSTAYFFRVTDDHLGLISAGYKNNLLKFDDNFLKNIMHYDRIITLTTLQKEYCDNAINAMESLSSLDKELVDIAIKHLYEALDKHQSHPLIRSIAQKPSYNTKFRDGILSVSEKIHKNAILISEHRLNELELLDFSKFYPIDIEPRYPH